MFPGFRLFPPTQPGKYLPPPVPVLRLRQLTLLADQLSLRHHCPAAHAPVRVIVGTYFHFPDHLPSVGTPHNSHYVVGGYREGHAEATIKPNTPNFGNGKQRPLGSVIKNDREGAFCATELLRKTLTYIGNSYIFTMYNSFTKLRLPHNANYVVFPFLQEQTQAVDFAAMLHSG